MRYTTMILVVAGLLAGCASTPSVAPVPVRAAAPTPRPSNGMTPMQAIMAAADRPEGVTATFEMEIRGGGRQNGWLYLNSEADYRDQRCLTIAVSPEVALELERKLAGEPVTTLQGKRVSVSGTAQRVKVWFFSQGIRTERYYYQTHVRLTDASLISIITSS